MLKLARVRESEVSLRNTCNDPRGTPTLDPEWKV
uniref:Uncharacterized protein n=1 Tax=Medicago truncatula TaxID=3880 RepID=Q2HRQ0_MEDTR|nr:hypothetical protein MtrDRAFT_AC158464g7v2 [Medicago truncatula]